MIPDEIIPIDYIMTASTWPFFFQCHFPISSQARMDSRVLGYKDLAALPRDKAILDIERPDLMIYEPHFTYSLLENTETLRSREVTAAFFFFFVKER